MRSAPTALAVLVPFLLAVLVLAGALVLGGLRRCLLLFVSVPVRDARAVVFLLVARALQSVFD